MVYRSANKILRNVDMHSSHRALNNVVCIANVTESWPINVIVQNISQSSQFRNGSKPVHRIGYKVERKPNYRLSMDWTEPLLNRTEGF